MTTEPHEPRFADLPDLSSARLPASYIAAKRAIQKCVRIDECQEWANKSEALASYAKQADDDTLRRLADRIQARAIRRCGELLRQIKPSKGGRPPETHDGAVTSLTRTQAAADAGLSERQKVTALRVASVPTDRFEELVESQKPATVTQLAEIGRKPKPQPVLDLRGRDPREFSISTQGQGMLRELATFASTHDPRIVARGALDNELDSIRKNIDQVRRWLAEVEAAVGVETDRVSSQPSG